MAVSSFISKGVALAANLACLVVTVLADLSSFLTPEELVQRSCAIAAFLWPPSILAISHLDISTPSSAIDPVVEWHMFTKPSSSCVYSASMIVAFCCCSCCFCCFCCCSSLMPFFLLNNFIMNDIPIFVFVSVSVFVVIFYYFFINCSTSECVLVQLSSYHQLVTGLFVELDVISNKQSKTRTCFVPHLYCCFPGLPVFS